MFALAVSGILLSGCGGEGTNESASSTTSTTAATPTVPSKPSSETVPGGGIGIFGGQWLLEGTTGLDPNLALELVVDDDASSISVRTSCNTLSGSYTLASNGSASMTLPGATKKACESEPQRLEQLALETLEDITSWESDETSLTLIGSGISLRFRPLG